MTGGLVGGGFVAGAVVAGALVGSALVEGAVVAGRVVVDLVAIDGRVVVGRDRGVVVAVTPDAPGVDGSSGALATEHDAMTAANATTPAVSRRVL